LLVLLYRFTTPDCLDTYSVTHLTLFVFIKPTRQN